jgi:hypothetical protein
MPPDRMDACRLPGRGAGPPAARRHKIAGAHICSARGDGLEQREHFTDRVFDLDHGDERGRCSIAGKRELEFRSRLAHDRAQPDIGGNRVEIDPPAAIHDHRDLGRECQPRVGDCGAKLRRKAIGVDQRSGIAGQRVSEDRHAAVELDVERGKRKRETRRRERREPSHLKAAARAYLHRAVAVGARRVAKAGEGIERDRRVDDKAHEEAVARLHRGRQARASAAHVQVRHGEASA